MLPGRIAFCACLGLIGLACAGIAGCGGEGDGTQASEGLELSGRSFVSGEAWSGESSAFSSPVTVTFSTDDALSWVGRCNTAGADVTVTDARLKVGKIASTAMGCEGPAVEQDEDLAAFFESGPSWHLDGSQLTLSSDSGEVQLSERVDAPQASTTSRGESRPPTEIGLAVPTEYEGGKLVASGSGCLACHRIGEDGNDGPGPDLTEIGSDRSRTELARALIKGPGIMPSYEELKVDRPRDFKDLVDFLDWLGTGAE